MPVVSPYVARIRFEFLDRAETGVSDSNGFHT